MASERFLASARAAARNLASGLEQSNTVIVFAESCTAGLVSAILAQVPGISNWLAGSFATYQDESKQLWLNVAEDTISTVTSVSIEVTAQMAGHALEKTERAGLSLAVTGHLEADAAGGAPYCFVCTADRDARGVPRPSEVVRKTLTAETRAGRQWQAAIFCLELATDASKKDR